MSVLSLFDCYCSIEEGFELAGYDVQTKLGNAIGIIGPANRKLVNSVRQLTPLFFVAINDHTKKIDIDGYNIVTHFSTSAEYHCSRTITWIIGIHSNDPFAIPFEFPSPSTDKIDRLNADTALSIAVAVAVTEAVDKMAVFNDYDKFYVFSDFNG